MPHLNDTMLLFTGLWLMKITHFFAVQCAVARHENPAVAGLYCVGHDYDAFASAFAEILYRLHFGHVVCCHDCFPCQNQNAAVLKEAV